ncbi:hypothetical protein INT43_003905 [Umbelopsis isabellina]|uniref:G-patch domain-containing protein n=1 Tax=Mortierella isabellina TaxID=91625 RepID=A0A8H7PTL9_MORIS|nr:hypothetical protein INT43_003905 [Umbelopsis isabellina]
MGLAGPRTKQRIGADPNNLHWSNDTGKFGHKMLTKMGWAPGKGLGTNEDGHTEHVKVRLKDNNFGIGANKKNMDNWLDNTDAFSRLLADLNSRVESEQSSATSTASKADDSEDSDASAKKSKKKSKKEKKDKKEKKSKKEKEKKEKKSKKESSDEEDDSAVIVTSTVTHRNAARAKFLRAKRLASGKDVESMSEILGIKSNSASASSSPIVTEEKVEVTTIENPTGVPMSVNKMNVQDYFALKMQKIKASGIASSGFKTNASSEEDKEEEEEETRPSFGGLGFTGSTESSSSLGFGLESRTNGLVTGNGLGFVKSTTSEMTMQVKTDDAPKAKKEKKEKSKKRKHEDVESDESEKKDKKSKEKRLKSEKSASKDKKVDKKEKKAKKEKKEKKSKK